MNRRVIAVFVAVLLALGGAALVINYVRNADARALAANQPTKVYVAQLAIPAGTSLKDAQRTDLIAETRVAAQALPLGALQEIGPDNNALLALSDIQPGEYLLSARFGTKPAGVKAIEVPSGMLAVSVELSDPARVGRFVTPGSHIAVYATYKVEALGDDEASKKINEKDVQGTSVLLDDVLVIGMGDSPLAAPTTDDKKEAAKGGGFLVTLALTPEQAPRLIHAITQYTLYAGLRGSDVKLDASKQVNDLNIFEMVKP